jgi:hypothetical protein
MIHAKAMAIVVAFDMYKELAEGKVNDEWGLDPKHIVSFYRFREKLAKQLLQYDPRNRKYPGDEKFRVSTSQPVSQRFASPTGARAASNPRTPRSAASIASSTTSGVTINDIKSAQKRLCGDLSHLMEHVQSIAHLPKNNKKVCAVCGSRTHYECARCGVALHYPSFTTKDGNKIACFLQYHNTTYYGLAKEDRTLVGVKHKQFELPNEERVKEHGLAMKRLRLDLPSPPPPPQPANASRRRLPNQQSPLRISNNSQQNRRSAAPQQVGANDDDDDDDVDYNLVI